MYDDSATLHLFSSRKVLAKKKRAVDGFGRISLGFSRLFPRDKFNGAPARYATGGRTQSNAYPLFRTADLFVWLSGKATSIHPTVKTLLAHSRICRRPHVVLYSADFLFPCDNALHNQKRANTENSYLHVRATTKKGGYLLATYICSRIYFHVTLEILTILFQSFRS